MWGAMAKEKVNWDDIPSLDGLEVGFFLGRQKIVSREVVRSVRDDRGSYRTGMEFVDLKEEYGSFIVWLISSRVYKSLG
jgi:hypothetical protein